MMRPITCLSLMVALGAGLYLYQVKHRAQLLDRDINRTVKLADQARDRIGLMKAEFALLQEPQRLADLAAHHLALQALAPGQFVRLEDLPGRLSPIPSAPAPNVPIASGPIASGQPEPPMASLAPPAPGPVQPPHVAPVAPTAVALANPAPRPAKPSTMVATNKSAESHPLYAPVMPAYVPNSNATHVPSVQNASATMASAAPPPPYVGSALGMSRTTLPPPTPVAGPPGANLASATGLGYAPSR